jgi:micrococcal nuclease
MTLYLSPSFSKPSLLLAFTYFCQAVRLLPIGQLVQMRPVTTDRYGRTVAELYLNNESINLQMIDEGQAAVYTQYLESCSETRNAYLSAEDQAKQKRIAFWNQANPTMPWDFRKQR